VSVYVLFVATGPGNNAAKLPQRPDGKSRSSMTSAQRATTVSLDTSSNRRPLNSITDTVSSSQPGVKAAQVSSSPVKRQVSSQVNEREIELQQQEYISRLLSSRRRANAVSRDHNPANQHRPRGTGQPVTADHTVSFRNSRFTRS